MGSVSFGDILLSTLWFMLVFAWIWLMVNILTDVFRDPSMSGWGKAAWTLFLIVFPWAGALVYLIARGRSMNERAVARARQQEAQLRQYVRDVAGQPGGAGAPGAPSPSSPSSAADELSKLAELRQRQVLNESEYERAKAAVIGSNGAVARPRS